MPTDYSGPLTKQEFDQWVTCAMATKLASALGHALLLKILDSHKVPAKENRLPAVMHSLEEANHHLKQVAIIFGLNLDELLKPVELSTHQESDHRWAILRVEGKAV